MFARGLCSIAATASRSKVTPLGPYLSFSLTFIIPNGRNPASAIRSSVAAHMSRSSRVPSESPVRGSGRLRARTVVPDSAQGPRLQSLSQYVTHVTAKIECALYRACSNRRRDILQRFGSSAVAPTGGSVQDGSVNGFRSVVLVECLAGQVFNSGRIICDWLEEWKVEGRRGGYLIE